MKRYLLWSLLALSLSANAAVAAVALRQRSAAVIPREPYLFSRVAVDPGQRERIRALRASLLQDRARQASELEGLRGALADQLVRAPENGEALTLALSRIEETQAAFQRRVVEHVIAVRSVLRPEQRPAFEEIVARQLRAGGPLQGACPNAPQDGGARP